MSSTEDLYLIADELRAVANLGLRFAESPYDKERYERVLSASARLIAALEQRSPDEVLLQFKDNLDHLSPNAGANAAVFRDGRILLIRREDDELWALPGGLAEVERRLRVGGVVGVLRDGVSLDIGDRIVLSDRTVIEVLSPPVQTAGRAHRSDNNRSLVLLVRIGELRILLPADIEAPAEQWLLDSGLDLRADALVLPHHGSKSSSSQAFVEAVQPRVAIVSAGAGNRRGQPYAEVLARYGGALLYRTDEHGDITLRSDGERLWVESAR